MDRCRGATAALSLDLTARLQQRPMMNRCRSFGIHLFGLSYISSVISLYILVNVCED
jgi:hypothetical protein